MRYHREQITDAIALLAVGAIAAAAVYEAAVALQWIPVGTVPGQGAAHEGWFMGMAAAASLLGIGLCIRLAFAGGRCRSAVPLAAVTAAWMVAHYYTFDTYYLPTLSRYSDPGGAFSATWVYIVGAAAGAASLLALVRPRVGFAGSAVTMLVCLFTIVFAGFGK